MVFTMMKPVKGYKYYMLQGRKRVTTILHDSGRQSAPKPCIHHKGAHEQASNECVKCRPGWNQVMTKSQFFKALIM